MRDKSVVRFGAEQVDGYNRECWRRSGCLRGGWIFVGGGKRPRDEFIGTLRHRRYSYRYRIARANGADVTISEQTFTTRHETLHPTAVSYSHG